MKAPKRGNEKRVDAFLSVWAERSLPTLSARDCDALRRMTKRYGTRAVVRALMVVSVLDEGVNDVAAALGRALDQTEPKEEEGR